MPKLDHISHSIALPEGASASIKGDTVTVSKDGQSLSREFRHPKVEIREVEGGLEIFVNLPRRSEKAIAVLGPRTCATWHMASMRVSNTALRQCSVTSR